MYFFSLIECNIIYSLLAVIKEHPHKFLIYFGIVSISLKKKNHTGRRVKIYIEYGVIKNVGTGVFYGFP